MARGGRRTGAGRPPVDIPADPPEYTTDLQWFVVHGAVKISVDDPEMRVKRDTVAPILRSMGFEVKTIDRDLFDQEPSPRKQAYRGRHRRVGLEEFAQLVKMRPGLTVKELAREAYEPSSLKDWNAHDQQIAEVKVHNKLAPLVRDLRAHRRYDEMGLARVYPGPHLKQPEKA